MLLAGGFHFYRGAPVDGCVFVGAGVLAAADARTQRRRPAPQPPPRKVVLPAVLTLSVLLAVAPLNSVLTGVVLVLLGLAALGVALAGSDRPPGSGWRWRRPSATGLAWTLIALAACLLELTVYFLGERRDAAEAVPALSDLLQPLVDGSIWRAVLVAGWLLLGVALLHWSTRPKRQDPVDRS